MLPLRLISRPLASSSPTLVNCWFLNPPDKGNCLAYNASVVILSQYVNSKLNLLLNKPALNPISNSFDTSGFRSGSPKLLGAIPAPLADASAKYEVKASKAPG